ncbi:MAG: hypothetical protein JST12_18615 [Armatimonadetes bacterium]|nr:hypothetical protein [Armatimonadota bacterium]
MKKVDPETLNCLKEALVASYWYKTDLNTFLRGALTDLTLLGGVNWDSHQKREAVDIVVNRIANSPEQYRADLAGLISGVCGMTDLSHLLRLEDGEKKAKRAKAAIEVLKTKAGTYRSMLEEEARSNIRREKQKASSENASLFLAKLHELKAGLNELVAMEDSQKRGFKLEKLLRELFELFDLDPKASFRIVGEQIDGAFTFDGTDFLLEAKWQKTQTACSDLDSFGKKIERKLENTLGLFISMGGYSPDGIQAHSQGHKVMILLDGPHLAAVLEGRLKLGELLLRSRRHASQTGEIYLPLSEVF